MAIDQRVERKQGRLAQQRKGGAMNKTGAGMAFGALTDSKTVWKSSRSATPRVAVFCVVRGVAYGAILFALPLTIQAASSRPRLTFREVSLGELKPQPFRAVINEVVEQSPDYQHVAFAAEQGDKVVIYVDGVPSKEHDAAGAVRFSPESGHVAYAASRSNKWFAVFDGREGKAYDRVGYGKEGIGPFVFSPDGKRLAYVAAEGGKECLVVDGREGEFFDEIIPITPRFSPNSQRVKYVARRGATLVVLVDSRELAECDEMLKGNGYFARDWFSPDSKRVAVTFKRAGKCFAIVDGVESQAWDEISDGVGHGFPEGYFDSVRFSPDSKHFVYEARRADEWSIVVDGNEKARGKHLRCLTFSPDSKRTAYVQLLDGDKPDDWKTAVVVDGVVGKAFDGSVESLFFSPDSKRLLYVARRGHFVEEGKQSLFENGVAGKEYDLIYSDDYPVFSPNGKRHAYVALRGESTFLVLDGKETRISEDGSIVSFTFSPDGKRWACFVETSGKDYVLVDGKRIGSYGIGNAAWSKQIVFSPDSRHFAFQAYHDRTCFLIVDGVEREISGGWLVDSELVFDSPTRLHGLVMRGYHLLRLEVELE